jgi:hypothetical protein
MIELPFQSDLQKRQARRFAKDRGTLVRRRAAQAGAKPHAIVSRIVDIGTIALAKWLKGLQAIRMGGEQLASQVKSDRILVLDYDKTDKPGTRCAAVIPRFLLLEPRVDFTATYQADVDFFQNHKPARSRLCARLGAVHASTDKTAYQGLCLRARLHIARLAGNPGKVLTA